jgi:elongation factor P
MATTNDLKNGMVLNLDGQLWQVIWFQHHKPGKGGAVVRSKLKSISSGKTVDKTFNADVKVEVANVDKRTMQYLYNDGTSFVFMDTGTFEQLEVPPEVVGDATNFLLESQEAIVATNDGNVLYIELPASVELEVQYTEPGLQGDRSTGGTKPATLETGHQISVPLFIVTGSGSRSTPGTRRTWAASAPDDYVPTQMSARSKARKRALDVLYASEMRNRSTVEALEEQSEAGQVNDYTCSWCRG